MTTSGPQDSPVWPPAQPGPQDRLEAQVAPGPQAAPAPAAPPTASPPARRRPNHPRRIAGAAAGVLVLAGAGAAVALAGVGHRVEQRDRLTHQISALTVNTGGGDVTVRTGGAPGTVEVTRKARSTGALAPLGPTSWQGDTLTLGGDCDGCSDIDYEIRVPVNVDVKAETGSGDIELDGGLGAVTLQAGSGDIDANVAVRTLSTRTGSGDIDLRLGNAPTQLIANSGSGDIDIRVPDGQNYVLDTRTGSGDIDNKLPQTNGADHRIQVETGSGDISVSGG